MHHKTCFAALTAALLVLTLCACSSKPAQQSDTEPPTEPGVTELPPADPDNADPGTEAPAETAAPVSGIPDALMNTVLSGVNNDGGALAVKFEGDKASVYMDADGTTRDGFWDLDGGMLHVYSDEAKTDELCSMQFDYNDVKNVLRLNGKVYMADTCTDSLEAETGKLSSAVKAYETLKDAYWGGGDSAYALIFKLAEDGSCDMHYYDGSDGIIDEATFFWAMGGDTIFFYNEDFAPVMHFNWSFDGNVFSLSDATTGTVIGCTPLSDEESSEVSRQLGVLAGAYESEGEVGVEIDYGNYQDFDVSVDP